MAEMGNSLGRICAGKTSLLHQVQDAILNLGKSGSCVQ